jgi:hypothetical protein
LNASSSLGELVLVIVAARERRLFAYLDRLGCAGLLQFLDALVLFAKGLAHLPNGAVFRLGFRLLAVERDNGFVSGFVVEFGVLLLVRACCSSDSSGSSSSVNSRGS